MKLVLVTPRVSEKAYRLVTNENTYIFDVPMSANKNEIKAVVEAQFEGSSATLSQRRTTLRPLPAVSSVRTIAASSPVRASRTLSAPRRAGEKRCK